MRDWRHSLTNLNKDGKDSNKILTRLPLSLSRENYELWIGWKLVPKRSYFLRQSIAIIRMLINCAGPLKYGSCGAQDGGFAKPMQCRHWMERFSPWITIIQSYDLSLRFQCEANNTYEENEKCAFSYESDCLVFGQSLSIGDK